jgi:hypothetical protein
VVNITWAPSKTIAVGTLDSIISLRGNGMPAAVASTLLTGQKYIYDLLSMLSSYCSQILSSIFKLRVLFDKTQIF